MASPAEMMCCLSVLIGVSPKTKGDHILTEFLQALHQPKPPQEKKNFLK
jgi:hypothetical protein